ncbi:hypothetical protein EYF80_062740 [Liparis tanakae]|uniref:Uncharacterized protein n=1 Tax=Liparis tanakae TaxID=230148 RepID=A0A4Z2EE00_9TELE|nr:hypothetical protein EYF80_062740 [Liparis tanakae]
MSPVQTGGSCNSCGSEDSASSSLANQLHLHRRALTSVTTSWRASASFTAESGEVCWGIRTKFLTAMKSEEGVNEGGKRKRRGRHKFRILDII